MPNIPNYAQANTTTASTLVWGSVVSHPDKVPWRTLPWTTYAPVTAGTIHAVTEDHVFTINFLDGTSATKYVPAGQSLPVTGPDFLLGQIISVFARTVTGTGIAIFNPYSA